MWATDVLPTAVVGTTAFQATTLTTGASDYTITKDGDGNVIISLKNDGNLGTYPSNYLACTLVVKINVPSTTTAGVLCHLRTASNEPTSAQGLYMDLERKLTTSWGNNSRKSSAGESQLTTGEHTIIYTANSGAKVYIDGTATTLTDTGLKAGSTYYKAIYIPAAYANYITEVHFYSSVQNESNITSIVTECSNHMHASQQSGTTANVASGKTLILDKAVAWTSLTGTGTVLQEVNIATTVAGNLPALTLKATAGTLTYTGSNLNGTTLDGVILGGSARITTSNTVNIKNLAGNNISGNNGYAFVGSGSLNFYGTCDLTKKSDGTTENGNCKMGYGSSEHINIKEGANVTTGAIFNTSTSGNNSYITVESGATLSVTDQIRSTNLTNNGTITSTNYIVANGPATNNGTITTTQFWGAVTLAEGSTTTLTDAAPFNSGAVTVSGDADLNLTATTSTLSQAITVDDSKTLTIDGKNNTVNLTGAVTNNGTINFKNATLTANLNDRSLTNYTFTNCTATLQFTETGDEYKVGGFKITNIPTGVTIKVKKYGTTVYETVTPVDGTVTISHSVGVSGTAAWLDYTFNESTKDTNIHTPADNKINNAGNAGSNNDLTIDGSYTTATSYNDDGTLKVMSTPWRDINWPTNYTVAVAGNVPDVENGCLVGFGSSAANSNGNYLAIIRGATKDEIKLVKGHYMNNAFDVITTMTAANATALSHLVVFTKNGNTFTVYLDGVQKTQVTYSETLGGGFQIGSVHGGVTGTGIARVDKMEETIKEKVFAKAVRVYDYVISDDQMSQLTTEFPYTSFGGKYTRTITENSNLSATNAWLNTDTQGNVDIPVNAVKDEVTYYPDVEITTDAASTLTVNANMDTENIKFDGAGKLTIASDGTHNIHVYGSVTANGPVSIKYGATDLSSVPVSIGESGSVEFDFSAYNFSSVNTPTDYPVTGNTADYGSKVTGVYPSDIYHTYTLAHNGTSNSYILTVAPTVAFFQQRAINLVKPYYDGNHVGSGLGKYIISLGETSYSNFVDFGIAVMSWQTLGDCVEPTIAINQPEEGFYRFKAAARSTSDATHNWYMGGDASSIYSASTTDAQASDANTIFYLEKTGENYQLLSYFSGMYSNGTQYNGIGTKSNFTLSEGIKENNTDKLIGQYRLYNTDTSKIIAMWENDYLNALTNENDWEGWTIEPVDELPVTFNSAALGYATFYTPVPLQIPAELNTKAYICKVGEKVVNENNVYTLTFYEIKNITTKDSKDNDVPTIPASTPVLLYNSDVSTIPVTVNFPITSFESVIDPDFYEGSYGTLAAETFDPTDTNRDIYSLRVNTINETKKVGFYKKVSGTTLGGFKMFLQTDHQSEARTFTIYFDGESAPTGIVEALGLENDNVDIYDLNGRKLSSYRKGINIVNGKKVMVQ